MKNFKDYVSKVLKSRGSALDLDNLKSLLGDEIIYTLPDSHLGKKKENIDPIYITPEILQAGEEQWDRVFVKVPSTFIQSMFYGDVVYFLTRSKGVSPIRVRRLNILLIGRKLNKALTFVLGNFEDNV